MLGDYAGEELEELGDAPIASVADQGLAFSALPSIAWAQGEVWRDRFCGAIDALADALAEGAWPQPRCPAEEMALQLALQHVAERAADEPELVERIVARAPVGQTRG
jgi:hypothetical protein